jgi:hypothetical protein
MRTGLVHEIWYVVVRGRTERDKHNETRMDVRGTKKLAIVQTTDEVRAVGKDWNLRHVSTSLLRKMGLRNKPEDINQKGYYSYKINVLVNPKHPKEGGMPIEIWSRYPCLQKVKLSRLRRKKNKK